MQNAAKKQNATLAMVFLFASLIITPLSLKAIGVFADGNQSVNAAELLALNRPTEDAPCDEATAPAIGLLASMRPLDVQLDDARRTIPDERAAEVPAAIAPSPAHCAKAVRSPRRVASPAPIAAAIEMPLEGVRAEALVAAQAARVAVPVRRETLRSYEQTAANYRFNLREVMRVVPRDFKLMLKVKSSETPALPALTTCALRKALSPEQVKQLRTAWTLTVGNAAESAEKSEL